MQNFIVLSLVFCNLIYKKVYTLSTISSFSLSLARYCCPMQLAIIPYYCSSSPSGPQRAICLMPKNARSLLCRKRQEVSLGIRFREYPRKGQFVRGSKDVFVRKHLCYCDIEKYPTRAKAAIECARANAFLAKSTTRI